MIYALNKMFATLPLPTANADPREALRVYCEACSNYSTDDVELAVRQFIEGTVKGVNAAFAPTAPQFVTQMRSNLEYTGRIRAGKNALLEQFKEQEKDEEWAAKRTPEVKAHIREMVEGFVNSVDEKKKPKTPEEYAKRDWLAAWFRTLLPLWFAAITATLRAVQQRHIGIEALQHDFSAVLIRAALVLPFTGL